ncbi:MAG: hypothetical protein MUD01_12510 [Chloroflexaceae bacterium]|nr:hypothetical protein [Chloroflexaceae bacterium]
MKQLHNRWQHEVLFVEVLVRQAHPGPAVPHYTSFEQKFADAQAYAAEHGQPWPVLVDDLAGTAHQVYGGMSDPIYLIDVEGNVAFYNLWGHPPTMHRAIEALLKQNGRGVVLGGVDQILHGMVALANGWPALELGLPQSSADIAQMAPGLPELVRLGYQAKPLLAPVALRAEPLPLPLRLVLGAAGLGLALGLVRRLRG